MWNEFLNIPQFLIYVYITFLLALSYIFKTQIFKKSANLI